MNSQYQYIRTRTGSRSRSRSRTRSRSKSSIITKLLLFPTILLMQVQIQMQIHMQVLLVVQANRDSYIPGDRNMSPSPTRGPTKSPQLSRQSSHQPSRWTASPSKVPTEVPTEIPSVPSASSQVPSLAPSVSPTLAPSQIPSELPSQIPSELPSELPSQVPSVPPSELPSSVAPAVAPAVTPSPESPSSETTSTIPLMDLSMNPSMNPSTKPSTKPSIKPIIPSEGAQKPSNPISQDPCQMNDTGEYGMTEINAETTIHNNKNTNKTTTTTMSPDIDILLANNITTTQIIFNYEIEYNDAYILKDLVKQLEKELGTIIIQSTNEQCFMDRRRQRRQTMKGQRQGQGQQRIQQNGNIFIRHLRRRRIDSHRSIVGSSSRPADMLTDEFGCLTLKPPCALVEGGMTIYTVENNNDDDNDDNNDDNDNDDNNDDNDNDYVYNRKDTEKQLRELIKNEMNIGELKSNVEGVEKLHYFTYSISSADSTTLSTDGTQSPVNDFTLYAVVFGIVSFLCLVVGISTLIKKYHNKWREDKHHLLANHRYGKLVGGSMSLKYTYTYDSDIGWDDTSSNSNDHSIGEHVDEEDNDSINRWFNKAF